MDKFRPAKRQRVAYVIAAIKSLTNASEPKGCGVGGKKFRERLVQELEATGSLDNRPGQGAHPRYTEEHFFHAATALLDGSAYFWSTKELVFHLIEEGLIPADTCPSAFWRTFKLYMASCGMWAVYGARRLTFALTDLDCQERLCWAHLNLQVFVSSSMDKFTFEDELVIDYGGKPKGEWHWTWGLRAGYTGGSCPGVERERKLAAATNAT